MTDALVWWAAVVGLVIVPVMLLGWACLVVRREADHRAEEAEDFYDWERELDH